MVIVTSVQSIDDHLFVEEPCTTLQDYTLGVATSDLTKFGFFLTMALELAAFWINFHSVDSIGRIELAACIGYGLAKIARTIGFMMAW